MTEPTAESLKLAYQITAKFYTTTGLDEIAVLIARAIDKAVAKERAIANNNYPEKRRANDH